MKPRLAILGAGHVAQTLARLWVDQGLVEITWIANRSLASAQQAQQFIGQGRAVDDLVALTPSDLILIGCPDDHVVTCANQLANCHELQGVSVFHCSGALSSEQLSSLVEKGAYTASVHPVKSFAEPAQSIKTFVGTFCGIEGDAPAIAFLEPLFEKIGGRCFALNAQHKTLYHAASVMACNYLVALEAVSLQLYQAAGLEQALAQQLMQPLVEGTVKQFFQLGAVQALTGPIARGDQAVVQQQLQKVTSLDSQWGELYRLLGQQALELAKTRGKLNAEQLQGLAQILR